VIVANGRHNADLSHQLLDYLFQFWVFLAHDLFELHSFQTGVLELRERPPGLDGLMLPPVAELYAQSDMDSMRDAQGKFLEQLIGDRIHLLTERVQ
jgi:hypothetical protein